MDDVSQMNKGVQILLERMSSNPDEFVPDLRNGYPPKWRIILLSVEMRMKGGKDYADQLPFLSDVEIIALWQKILRLQGELFTKKVMNTLLRDSVEDNFLYANVANTTYPTTIVPLQALTNTELRATLNNLSPIQKEELSSLSRQVTGGSPRTKL
jgi:hypothetical protein